VDRASDPRSGSSKRITVLASWDLSRRNGGDLTIERSPAFQFYPKDFLTSTKVGLMSMTERGIYITLLSHCWLEGGVPTDMGQLARLVGMKPAQFTRLWEHGPLHGCFENRDGLYVNPRMEDDRHKRAAYLDRQRSNGSGGGRPRVIESDRIKDKTSGLISHNPGEEGDEDRRSLLLREKKCDADFTTFWHNYPKHDGKQAALKAWRKLNPDEDTQRVILADIDRRSRSAGWLKDAGQFIPHASTYLNQKRWEDGFVERPRLVDSTVQTLSGAADFLKGA